MLPNGQMRQPSCQADLLSMLTRPDPAQPSLLEPTGLGKLRFRWEGLHSLAREILPLFQQHWQEIALDRDIVPLDPDWDNYYDLATTGKLHVLTAREVMPDVCRADSANEKLPADPLVGYVFNLIGGHLHYNSTKFAHTEMFWLMPEYRFGWNGFKLLKYNLRGLKQRGVVVSTINIKLGFKNARVGQLLARLGYAPTDIVLRKVL